MEEVHIIRPTLIMRFDAQENLIGVLTAGEGDEEALMVFRSSEDAEAFVEYTGQYALAEGFKLVAVGHETIAALLEKRGIRWVAMPEPRPSGDDAGVDVFAAEDFISMLEQSLGNWRN